jgi:acyl-CoA reductase-like NAD-dependent aldehyde dehydrogenase
MSGPIISVRTGLHIDGAWRAASDGDEIEVLDPASVKQSGVDREGSHEGMLEFLEKKYIAVDW